MDLRIGLFVLFYFIIKTCLHSLLQVKGRELDFISSITRFFFHQSESNEWNPADAILLRAHGQPHCEHAHFLFLFLQLVKSLTDTFQPLGSYSSCLVPFFCCMEAKFILPLLVILMLPLDYLKPCASRQPKFQGFPHGPLMQSTISDGIWSENTEEKNLLLMRGTDKIFIAFYCWKKSC